jgi:hypothetical protein
VALALRLQKQKIDKIIATRILLSLLKLDTKKLQKNLDLLQKQVERNHRMEKIKLVVLRINHQQLRLIQPPLLQMQKQVEQRHHRVENLKLVLQMPLPKQVRLTKEKKLQLIHRENQHQSLLNYKEKVTRAF